VGVLKLLTGSFYVLLSKTWWSISAVIRADSEVKLCASLLQPNETLVMTISLIANEQNKILLQESSDQEFHRCFQFQVSPTLVDIQNHSIRERKVMIKPYSLMTFIQTDKPIYNPGCSSPGHYHWVLIV
uniref:Uncharacterized protein n=1 Tax=Oncorhynchus tshawytscha TaxID=74940 RepID=A0A8C8CYD6_ONCTS